MRWLLALVVVLGVAACGTGPHALPTDAAGPGQNDRTSEPGTGQDAASSGPDVATSGSETPPPVPPPERGRVVDPAGLEAVLGHPGLQILDARQAALHRVERIPGALQVSLDQLNVTVNGVANEVAPIADLEAAFGRAGLERDLPVIVYADSTDIEAARMVWTLEHVGHRGVTLLDGGLSRWKAEGRPLESTPPAARAPSVYRIDAVVDALKVDAGWVAAHLADERVKLVDARSGAEFQAGRLPGAHHVDWTRNVPGGAFAPRDQVAALYPSWDPAQTIVVTYCQTGMRASVAYVTLRWLGFADVRVYDGSWAEWETLDPALYPREKN